MRKKHIFIQDTGIFVDEFVVAVGCTEKDIRQFAKKEKLKKELFLDVVFEDDFKEIVSSDSAYTIYNKEFNNVVLVNLSKNDDSWDFLTSLLHEVVHVVQRIEIRKGLQKEDEARAYLTEYLFTNIRRKIYAGKHSIK
ncbi:MAG: hypothetical protein WC803_12730 [Sphingomonas sp.]|jgi:transcription antitermination factor NusG